MADIKKITLGSTTYNIRDDTKQPIGNYVTTDTAQTISGAKTITGITKIQNGAASGAFVLGANVNATTLTANQRKLGRMGVPSYDSTTKTVAGISFDSQQNANYADFGGHPNNASSIAPDVIRFTVADEHNNSISGDRSLALEISNQSGLVDTAGGGTSDGTAKFYITINATKGIKTNIFNIPTSSGGTTYGAGSSGQVLKSNGSTIYWGTDNNTDTKVTVDPYTIDAEYPIVLNPSTSGTSNTNTMGFKTGVTINPSTSTITASYFNGFIVGGRKTGTTIGDNATAEGFDTTASGESSHAEGDTTTASGEVSHAEGASTTASGYASHAEGNHTTALGDSSHAEGIGETSGARSFKRTTTECQYTSNSPIRVGTPLTNGSGIYYVVTDISGESPYTYTFNGDFTTTANAWVSLSTVDGIAYGDWSHAEGANTTASGDSSHAEGNGTTAFGENSHAEGYSTTASGTHSHAEGRLTTASGSYSHAEGQWTNASNYGSHAEGSGTTASGAHSHAEGYYTTASGEDSHAEGNHTTASGDCSHAEGYGTTAASDCSHAEGYNTTAASENQHVQGKYNIEDSSNKYAHIVGNGETNSTRSNAHTLDWSGNAWFAGTVRVGGTSWDDATELGSGGGITLTDLRGL